MKEKSRAKKNSKENRHRNRKYISIKKLIRNRDAGKELVQILEYVGIKIQYYFKFICYIYCSIHNENLGMKSEIMKTKSNHMNLVNFNLLRFIIAS